MVKERAERNQSLWHQKTQNSSLQPKYKVSLEKDQGAGLPQWVHGADHQATENYSQVLEPNGIFPAELQTCFISFTLLFLPISPFWNRNIYITPALPLYLGSK